MGYNGTSVPSGLSVFTTTADGIPDGVSVSGTVPQSAFTSVTPVNGPSTSYSNIDTFGTGLGGVSPSVTSDNINSGVVNKDFTIAASADGGSLIDSAGSSSSTTPSSSASVPSVTFLDNIANEYNQFAYHIQFFAASESGSGTSVVIAESGVTGFNISSLIIKANDSAGMTTSVAASTEFTMVITEPLGTSFLDALKGAANQVGISNSEKSPYHIAITFRGYDEDGNPTSNACSSWPNGGVWNYSVFIGATEFHVTASGATYTIHGNIIAMTGLTNPAAARTQQVTAPTGKTLGELLTAFMKQLNDSPANKGLFNYSVAYQQGLLPNPSSFKFSQSPTTDVATMRGYREADKMKSGANFPPGALIVDAISSVIGATVEGQKYIVNSDGSLQPGATSANGKYRDAGLYRVIPTVTVGKYNSQTNNYAQNIVFNIKGSKVQNTSIDGSESNGKNGPAALSAINNYGGMKKRYMYNFTGLNTEVLELNTTFNFSGVHALPSANGTNYFTDNVRQGAAVRSSTSSASSSSNPISSLLGAVSSISNAASTAIGAGTSFANAINSTVSGVSQAISSATNGLNNLVASTSLAASGGFGGTLNTATSLVSQVASIINNNSAQSSSTTGVSGGLSSFGGAVYMEDLLPITTETNQTSTIQSYNTARLDAGSGTPTQGNSGKSVFGAIVSQITGFQSTFMTNLGNFKIKGDPYWLGMDHDNMVKNTDTSGGLPDHSHGDICFLLDMQFPYNWAETGNATFLQNQQFTGVYSVTRIESHFTNGQFTQVLTAVRCLTVTKDNAMELLAKSTVQSSKNGVGGSSSSSGSSASSVGSFISGLGSLISGGTGTSIPTTQSSNAITTAAPDTTSSSSVSLGYSNPSTTYTMPGGNSVIGDNGTSGFSI